jgi:ribosome-associated protein
LSRAGVIVITAERFRTRERNRADALDRLVELIRRAAERPKTRRPTKATGAAKAKRRDNKTRRGQLKRLRQVHVDKDS